MCDGVSDPQWGLGELSETEHRLRKAFPRGEVVDLTVGDPDQDDPQRGAAWDERRRVRAEFVAALALSGAEPYPGRVAAVRLVGAQVEGPLNLADAEVGCPVVLQGCWFAELVRLHGATASRGMSLAYSVLPSLEAHNARIEGLELKGCRTRRINLLGADVAGELSLDGAQLTNPGGPALLADRLVVEKSMACGMGFAAEGEFRLPETRIGGELLLDGARLTNPGGRALFANGLVVEKGVSGEELVAAGEVRILGARIAGSLDLTGARLTNPDRALIGDRLLMPLRNPGSGWALVADGLVVEGAMFCRAGFTTQGGVRLVGARIAGQLSFNGASLADPVGSTLLLQEAQAGSLWLADGFTAQGRIDLSGSRVGTLVDDPQCWPVELDLNDLMYDDLEPDLHSRRRLEWLRRGVGTYRAQPYEQLAAHYRRQGHDEEARRVLLAKQRHRRAERPWHARVWGYLLDGVVGYGYRPGWAACWMLVLLIAGSVFFTFQRPYPIKPGEHPPYQPVWYTVDLLLPIVNLGQEGAFAHRGVAQWLAYVMILLGWLLATAVVGGVTRVLTRK